MAGHSDEDLLQMQADAAAAAAQQGADPGKMATHLAGMQSAAMGQSLAQRYANIGAKWLADQAPTRLDRGLIERLSRMGFRSDTLADVRIHRGPRAQQAADALTARAFAVGDGDVFFGRGEFDPHTRSGMAVLAHELAHIAPPDAGPGIAPSYGGGVPTSFGGGPIINERKRGDEDSAGEEAHERVARQAEARVFAMDDGASSPSLQGAPVGAPPVKAEADAKQERRLDPAALEAKVMQILQKWERGETERTGQFVLA